MIFMCLVTQEDTRRPCAAPSWAVIGISLGLGLAVLALMVSLHRPFDLVWHELGRRRGVRVLANVWMT